MSQSFLFQDVHDLLYLVVELGPLFRVVGHKGALSRFLGDNQESADLGVRPAFIVAKIALCQELHPRCDVVVIGLSAKDVLLLKGVALAQGLQDLVQHVHKGVVPVGIGTILRHGVLCLDDAAAVALLAVQNGVHYPSPCVGDVLDARKKSVQCVFPNAHTDDDNG